MQEHRLLLGVLLSMLHAGAKIVAGVLLSMSHAGAKIVAEGVAEYVACRS